MNQMMASEALLMQMVVGSIMSKESGDQFIKSIKGLLSGG